MIATLALLIALQADWTLPPLFPTVFPNPTGANAIEDYTLAMDLLRAEHDNAYRDWQSPEDRAKNPPPSTRNFPGESPSKLDPRFVELVNRLDGLNLLQFRQDEAAHFTKALDLVASGNGKGYLFTTPVQDFRFPPVGDLVGLANLATDSSYVALSEGRGAKAADDASRILFMLDRLARHSYFSVIVSISVESKVFAAINENLDRYSLEDAKNLELVANTILQQPPACLEAHRNEMLQAKDAVRELVLNDRKSAAAVSDDKETESVNKLFRSLSDADAEAMIQRIQQSITEREDLAKRRMSGPEDGWMPQTYTDEPGPALDLPNLPKTISSFEAVVSWNWTPPFARKPSALLPVLRSRAQLRLARLHARIIQFRWEWDRLPKSLAELGASTEYTYDPLSHQQFAYDVNDTGYRLYSKGWNGTGPVDLNYTFSAIPRNQKGNP